MPKLIEVTFTPKTHIQVMEVAAAFCQPFPSLEHIPNVVPEILDYLDTGVYHEEIQETLKEDSVPGEDWWGHVYLTVTERNGKETQRTVTIEPYVGDRVLTIHRGYGGWLVTADYSARPSRQAAAKIIKLADNWQKNGGHNSEHIAYLNPPEWEGE